MKPSRVGGKMSNLRLSIRVDEWLVNVRV